MKKSNSLFRSIIAILLSVVVLFFSFGPSQFSYSQKRLSFQEENLAVQAKTITEFGKGTAEHLIDGDYKTVWVPKSKKADIILDFEKPISLNTVVLREQGWNIKDFELYYAKGADVQGTTQWERFYRGDKIEDFRICATESITTNAVKIKVNQSNARFKLSEIEIYDVQPTQKDFQSCGYLVTRRFIKQMDAKPGEPGYVSPEIFQNMKRVTLIGQMTLDGETGEMRLNPMDDSTDTWFEAARRELDKKIGDNEVEIFASAFKEGGAILDEPVRSIAIQNALDFLIKYDLDGFDFDWEFPTTEEEFRKLSEFIVEMEKAFEPYGKKISTAWYAWDVSLSKEAIEAIDYVNVMGYDEYDQDGNICSFMSGAVQPIQYFLDMGFKPEQIYLGLPQYSKNHKHGKEVFLLLNEPDVKLDRFTSESNGFVFNSPQLIADKTAYAIEEGIGGVFVWSIETDKPLGDEACISQTIDRVIQQRTQVEREVEN